MSRRVIACLLAGAFPVASHAAILNATPANVRTVFAAARDGDTINLVGTFGAVSFENRMFTTPVTVNASQAVFTDTMRIRNTVGLTVTGGTFDLRSQTNAYWRAMAIDNSNAVKILNGTFLGNGANRGFDATQGIVVTQSRNVQVGSGTFNNFLVGITVRSSNSIQLAANRINASTSEGINIADSHFVTAMSNSCSGFTPFPGSHPDCIQLWSIAGNAPQSNITLSRNVARGSTQGFTSFNASSGGGVRISMIDNTVATSWSEGIACYGCFDSIITGNVVSTLPGSQWQTLVRVIGGANNVVANNSIAAYQNWPATSAASVSTGEFGAFDYLSEAIDPPLVTDMPSSARGMFSQATAFDDFGNEDIVPEGYAAIFDAVPEPGTWAQLILGFGLVGASARRRTRAPA
jgi:hypothetical protein